MEAEPGRPMGEPDTAADARSAVAKAYEEESRRVLATLIRILGDFTLAEDALHDAFAAAVEQWPREGVPRNPRAWLISAGRFKAIDAIRRRTRFDESTTEIADRLAGEPSTIEFSDEVVADDQLRLIFTCCHPALPPEARVALTLREVCGLTTEEIARAFLAAPPTVAQRIVRAKAKIRAAKIPYEIPSRADLPERLDTVLQVIYLVFNEGYSASFGESVTRADLSGEAVRLGRLLLDLLPDPEVMGLLALMLLTEARREARTSASGELILLEDQDRSSWNRELIREGVSLVERALRSGRFGPYSIQAAIAAVHSEAPSTRETDWAEIVGLYDVLLRLAPSPIIALNRAVAIAMRDGPAAGLEIVDALLDHGHLTDYHLAHATRGELNRQIGRIDVARAAFTRALELVQQEPERRFLEGRIAGLDAEPGAHPPILMEENEP